MRVLAMVVFWAISLLVFLIASGVLKAVSSFGLGGPLMTAGFVAAFIVAIYSGHRALFGPRTARRTETWRVVISLLVAVTFVGLPVVLHMQQANSQEEALRLRSEAAAELQAQLARQAEERRAAEAAAAAERIADERAAGIPARVTAPLSVADPILWLPVGAAGFQNGGALAAGERVDFVREVLDRGGMRHAVVRLSDGRLGWVPADRVELIRGATGPSSR